MLSQQAARPSMQVTLMSALTLTSGLLPDR
jgi:hypothetical protein